MRNIPGGLQDASGNISLPQQYGRTEPIIFELFCLTRADVSFKPNSVNRREQKIERVSPQRDHSELLKQFAIQSN